jgi:hypothetical protein
MFNKKNIKSGMRKVETIKPCRDREHNPPNMLVVPPGHEYVHICPSCGAVSVLHASNISLDINKLEEEHHNYVMENAMWASPESRHRYFDRKNNLTRQ